MTERIYGRPMINGDEVDAFKPRRQRGSARLDRAGVRRKTKTRCCRRERHQARAELRRYR
jgi:hypothetical protein